MQKKVQKIYFIITGFAQICTNVFYCIFIIQFCNKMLKICTKNTKICMVHINPGSIDEPLSTEHRINYHFRTISIVFFSNQSWNYLSAGVGVFKISNVRLRNYHCHIFTLFEIGVISKLEYHSTYNFSKQNRCWKKFSEVKLWAMKIASKKFGIFGQMIISAEN